MSCETVCFEKEEWESLRYGYDDDRRTELGYRTVTIPLGLYCRTSLEIAKLTHSVPEIQVPMI
jgi:hypothetical protein